RFLLVLAALLVRYLSFRQGIFSFLCRVEQVYLCKRDTVILFSIFQPTVTNRRVASPDERQFRFCDMLKQGFMDLTVSRIRKATPRQAERQAFRRFCIR